MAQHGDETRDLVRQGIEFFGRRQYVEAQDPLERAARNGDAEAQNLLGVMALNGMGSVQDSRRAATFFEAAAASGLKEGHYNLSNLLYNGMGLPRDGRRAQAHLLKAATAGHRPALRNLGYLYHLAGPSEPWPTLAIQCFRLAAEAGDALAKYSLALKIAQGLGAEPDGAAARRWLEEAAAAGIYLAQARLRELPATQAGNDGQREPHAVATPLVGFPAVALPVPQPTRTAAFVSEYMHALDPVLADHLINVATASLQPSGVVDPKTGQAVRSQLRTSYSMSFMPSMYDAVTAEIVRRIAAVAGLPPENAEPVGVLRYGPGQEYRPHYDYYTDDQHEAQRTVTVFIYLNDVAEGGGTEFPRLGVRIEPKEGKAVKFLNCDAEGRPNPETLHAGLPVVRGEKWLATLWFWDRPFTWFR